MNTRARCKHLGSIQLLFLLKANEQLVGRKQSAADRLKVQYFSLPDTENSRVPLELQDQGGTVLEAGRSTVETG